jgi:acetyl esterase/lipase
MGRVDPMQLVDPELRPGLEQALKSMPACFGELTSKLLQEIRTRGAAMAPPAASAPLDVERMVPGERGAPDIRVYVINADGRALRTAVVHMHGGGFFTGAAVSRRG